MLFLRLMKGNLEIWQWILLLTILLPMAIKDYRTKKVNIYICLITIFASLYIRTNILGEADIYILIDLIPGVLSYVASILTKEAIGKGDALVLLFIGSVMGYRLELEAIAISILISGIISLILFVIKKVDRKTEIPFVPFLSLGVFFGGIL